MKRAGLLMAIGLIAIGALPLAMLPPPRQTIVPFDDHTVAGSLHIHTTRSDGRNTPEEIAAIAARLGRKFLIFTDHGDGTRVPDPPTYRSGVLCLDAVEISTGGGHYVAIDMAPSAYPLAGEPRDVVEDVRRLGGFGVAAHPSSPKPELRWQDWSAPFDGVEWENPDTSWRVYASGPMGSRLRLLAGLVQYPIRPTETIANLLTEPDQTIAQWNAVAARRSVVGLLGVDAHAKLAFRNVDPGDNRYTVPVPSYEASLSVLSVHVEPDRALTGDAAADAGVLMRAIRGGHLYLATDGLASPPALEFTASNGTSSVGMGGELAAGSPVTLRVRSNAPPGYTTIVWRNRQMLAVEHRNEITVQSGPNPAVYRVEIRSTDATNAITWLYSNPVYVRAAGKASQPAADPGGGEPVPLFDGQTTDGWHIEEDGVSTTAVNVTHAADGDALALRYTLGPGEPAGQRSTLVRSLPREPERRLDRFRALRLQARAEHPMRVSIQLRTPDTNRSLRRWIRSVFLDDSERTVSIPFDEMQPAPENPTPHPPLDEVNAVMLVVDTINTKPGSSGTVWIRQLALEP